MKTRLTFWLGLGLVLAYAAPAMAARTDAIWARSTNGSPITMDGNLNEAAWSIADSVTVRFGIDAGVPGSGWKYEGGKVPIDSTVAVLKFLTVGNQLYMGARVKDQSVGGSELFNRFDGFIMDLKDHNVPGGPKPVAEYFWSWQNETQTGTPPLNQVPTFYGRWGEDPRGTARTPEQISAWDAAYVVYGTVNEDTVHAFSPKTTQLDGGYTVEMRFDLAVMGYDVTQPAGDIVEWNISIYDCDWFWPLDAAKFSTNRVWWQDPWGNVGWYGEVRLHCKPSVNIASGPAPVIQPEMIIPSAGALPAPVVDGNLNDPVWAAAPHFDMRYGDDALRASYGKMGEARSGQYEPFVNGSQAFVIDPGDATVKYIIKGNWLYFAFDVRDQAVQYIADPERWDGFRVILTEKTLQDSDKQLKNRQISFQVGPGGTLLAQDFLPFLRDTAFGAQAALLLKAGTTVDTTGITPDVGYTAELGIDLTKLGYPPGLGDGIIHLGIDMLDGDSFTPFSLSYSTRTWFMRERENTCCPIWAYADPTYIVDAGAPGVGVEEAYAILGAAPNPGRVQSSIQYRLAERSAVKLETYDPAGRLIARRDLGVREAGIGRVAVSRAGASGVVFYRLHVTDPASGAERASLSGKLTFLQ